MTNYPEISDYYLYIEDNLLALPDNRLLILLVILMAIASGEFERSKNKITAAINWSKNPTKK
ncbi:MAG: hypothetical protein LUQ65_02455 [Candidatus Helarchaeota archaeon]|nr:hypothetical protein [Candidatus Helarchaeota archaeon]